MKNFLTGHHSRVFFFFLVPSVLFTSNSYPSTTLYFIRLRHQKIDHDRSTENLLVEQVRLTQDIKDLLRTGPDLAIFEPAQIQQLQLLMEVA